MSSSTSPEPAGRLTRAEAVSVIVDAAIDLLAQDGPSQIQARSVARAAGVSTSAVYYHLGGLPELMQAIIDRGFTDLADTFAAISPSTDPVADLFRMALATRQLAKNNPHLYDLMFGLSTRGSYRPADEASADSRERAFESAYGLLVAVAARLVASGRIRPGQGAACVADLLWSGVHGFVALEVAGHFASLADPVEERLQPLTISIFVGLGDTASRAQRSHATVSRDSSE